MCELLQIRITFSGFYANLDEESSQQIGGNTETGGQILETQVDMVRKKLSRSIEYNQEK